MLAYLTPHPMHPHELGRALRQNGDARSIKFNNGSLYMVVRQLAKTGFIAEQGTSREGQRPERTMYALTDTGREELHSWLSDLVGEPRHEYPAFVTALSLVAALPPGEVADLLRERRGRLAQERSDIRALIDTTLASGAPGLFLIEEEYRLATVDAEATYVGELLARMSGPATDWVGPRAAFHDDPPAP